MRPLTRCSMLGVLGAMLAVSCAPENLMPFAHSGEVDAGTGIPGVVKGRIWVTPNPIRVPVPTDGTDPACVPIQVDNIGSDSSGSISNVPVVIESMTVAGAPAIDFYDEQMGQSFPQSFTGGFGGLLCTFPGNELPSGGTLVLRTSDPTSPTVRVPILVDSDQEPTFTYELRAAPILIVRPNPIELSSTTGSLLVNLWPHWPGTPAIPAVELTDVTVTGAGLSLTGMTCGSGNSLPCLVSTDLVGGYTIASITLVVDPQAVVPGEGELRVASNDTEGNDHELVVPILIR